MHATLRRRASLLVAVLVTRTAAADPVPKVALAPLASMTEHGPSLSALESEIASGFAAIKGIQIISPDEIRGTLKRQRRHELEACDGELHCLAELGKLVGASVVVSGEAGGLAEGQVVYLKAVDVASQTETGSTTLLIQSKASPATNTEARAAAMRLLSPKAYVGSLILKIDVTGAMVYVDGKALGSSPLPPLAPRWHLTRCALPTQGIGISSAL